MSDHEFFASQRKRTAFGLAVVVALLTLTAIAAGVGFAGGSISADQYQNGKTTICHHTHSRKHPAVTITINQNAWLAHQRHGDTQGACSKTGTTGASGPTGTTGPTGATGATDADDDSGLHGDSGDSGGGTGSSHGHGDGGDNGGGNDGNHSGHGHDK
jgi:hypothetical protein